jgi:hypothetical protein
MWEFSPVTHCHSAGVREPKKLLASQKQSMAGTATTSIGHCLTHSQTVAISVIGVETAGGRGRNQPTLVARHPRNGRNSTIMVYVHQLRIRSESPAPRDEAVLEAGAA